MQRALFLLLMTGALLTTSAQPRELEAHYNYLSLGTNVYTNTAGTIGDKTFVTAEFGRTFGIFDIGLMVGRLSMHRSDTSWFSEIEPTINVFSKGRFSEALTLGAGYIYGARNNFLTEVTNSINFAPNNNLVITIFQGNYFLDGKLSTSKAQFIGLSATVNFISKNSKIDVLRKKSLLN